jgi:hypothetical protein
MVVLPVVNVVSANPTVERTDTALSCGVAAHL